MDIPYLTKVKYPLQQNFNTPIEEKFKDNKYNNDKQNFKKTKANFEERAYEGFNFDTLYANYSMMKRTSYAIAIYKNNKSGDLRKNLCFYYFCVEV